MSRILNRELLLGGKEYLIGASNTRVRVIERDHSKDILKASGSTVPTDGDSGYAIGCEFLWDSGSKGMVVFINEGSATSCDFNQVLSGGGAIVWAPETIAAGGTSTALDLELASHYIDADAGGDTFTIAAGTEGQIMSIVMASATGVATITPASFRNGTSVTLNAAGDSVILQYIGSSWNIIGGVSYTIV